MPYDWIDEAAIPPLARSQRLALFGAGEGSVQFLQWLANHAPSCLVLAVADNDPTMHGRSLHGLPIVPPEALTDMPLDLVVVTTVSGREAVGEHLAARGLVEGRDFVRIGAYPAAGVRHLPLLLEMDGRFGVLAGASEVLHVGPGGFLGLECGLHALYGLRVTGLDAYGFGLAWPEVTARRSEYAAARQQVLALARGRDAEAVAARWDGMFAERGAKLFLVSEALRFLFPYRFSDLPLPDDSLDLVCSFAVLEHVRRPERCAEEIRRVLRPGGYAVLTIVTRDHRSFGKVEGYSPISYRRHSAEEWERINAGKFYQNRLAPWQWRELFRQEGLDEAHYRIHSTYVPDAVELSALHPDFSGWSKQRQSEVDCTLVLRKA